MKTNIDKLNYIHKVAAIHAQNGSLAETSKIMNISRERVRQILLEGKAKGIIDYTTAGARKENQLKDLITDNPKSMVIDILIKSPNVKFAAKALKLDRKQLNYLIKTYHIKRSDYYFDKFKTKYLEQYMEIFNKNGYHPSTTELQSTNKTRILYNALCKYWGGINKFRREFGVTKSQHFMTKEGYINWVRAVERGKLTKQHSKLEHKKMVMQLLLQKKFINRNEFSKITGLSKASIANYLNELQEEAVVVPVKLKNEINYRIDLQNPKSMLYLKQEQDEAIAVETDLTQLQAI